MIQWNSVIQCFGFLVPFGLLDRIKVSNIFLGFPGNVGFRKSGEFYKGLLRTP